MNSNDHFVDMVGYENLYSIDAFGKIKSKKSGNFLKPAPDKDGYMVVRLTNKDKGKSVKVHRLVALTFIPNNNNKPQVNHIDGKKQNNVWWNLEWVTNSENQKHNFLLGISSNVGEKSPRSKVSEKQVIEIRELRKTKTLKEIAAQFNITQYHVSAIALRRSWNHI